jgi:Holliday junction resolvasome RuvABC endonuclease subunit
MRSSRIIAVDPASHSLAWAILDTNEDGIKIVDFGKIDFSTTPELSNKFNKIKQEIPKICKEYKPSIGVIEQSVYIQNFQASRILSYIIGFTWGELDDYCDSVTDVNPLKWKSGIGYKNLTQKEVKLIKDKYGSRGIQKRLNDERKIRVRNILLQYFSDLELDGVDSDISDAMGIGLWYCITHGS